MRKFGWLAVLLFALVSQGFSQTFFVSQPTGGAWNVGTTWDQTGCTSGCVAGVDYPGLNDVAVIAVNAGAFVSFPRVGSPAFSVKDLFVVYNVTNTIRTTGLSGTPSLTISGQLSGALDDLSDVTEPSVNVFHTSAANLNIIFTGSNLDDPFSGSVITSWGFNSPIYRATINPGTGNIARVDNFATRSSVTVQSGTLQINPGQELRDFTGTSVLTVSTGAILSTQGAINGGSTTTRFGTITVNGTLTSTSSTSTYVNAATFNLGPSAALNNGFRGPNQTQGWWYQTTSPSTIALDATSTVQYNSGTDQFVYATNYGNLTFGNVPGTVTKTLSGSGMILRGNLTIGTNVVFSPSTQVDFTGSATQTITGAGTLSFNGGIEVTKPANALSINRATTIANGIIVSQGTLNLNAATSIAGGIQVSNDITAPGVLNLGNATITLSSGNVDVFGTLSANASNTLTVSGTTDFTDTGSGSMTLNNLTVSGNTTVSRSQWSITGNITNNGTLTIPPTTLVTFSGGSAQAIAGNAFAVGNMTVNKTSSTLSNNGNVELFGVLTMTTGTFDADGSGSGILTLNSDTNGDARIGPMAGGSIIGEVTFERYFNNTTVNLWRNLAFPVSSVTYTELGASVPLAANSVAYYTESTLGNVDQGWTYVSSGTLNSARGHSVRMLGAAPINVSVRGPLLQQVPAQGVSPYNFNVTYTNDPAQPADQDGWNYTPNPFASPIDWNNSGWVKTNVDAAAAVWDVQNYVYRYTNIPVNMGGWDGIAAQGQAFWVHTNAANPVLTATEAVKEAVSDPVFYRVGSVESRLFVHLKSEMFEDVAAVQFRNDASPEFDSDLDAYKLKNMIFNISTLSPEGSSFAANTLPRTPCTSDIRLNITNIEPGSYTLEFDGLDSFADLESLELVDNYAKTSVTLEGSASHTFEVTADAASYGAQRFELKFKFSDANQIVPAIAKLDDVLTSQFAEGESYQWFLNGEPVEGATLAAYHPVLNGTYTYEVIYKGCALVSESVTVEAKKRVFPNPVSGDLNVQISNLIPNGVGAGEIVIQTTMGTKVKEVTFDNLELVKTIDMRDVRPGQYIVSIFANSKIVERVKIIVQ